MNSGSPNLEPELHPCWHSGVDSSPTAEDISLLFPYVLLKNLLGSSPGAFWFSNPQSYTLNPPSDWHHHAFRSSYTLISVPTAHPQEVSLTCSRTFHSIWPSTGLLLSTYYLVFSLLQSSLSEMILAYLFAHVVSMTFHCFNKLRLFCRTQCSI